jgi:hypothetical protein
MLCGVDTFGFVTHLLAPTRSERDVGVPRKRADDYTLLRPLTMNHFGLRYPLSCRLTLVGVTTTITL